MDEGEYHTNTTLLLCTNLCIRRSWTNIWDEWSSPGPLAAPLH